MSGNEWKTNNQYPWFTERPCRLEHWLKTMFPSMNSLISKISVKFTHFSFLFDTWKRKINRWIKEMNKRAFLRTCGLASWFNCLELLKRHNNLSKELCYLYFLLYAESYIFYVKISLPPPPKEKDQLIRPWHTSQIDACNNLNSPL